MPSRRVKPEGKLANLAAAKKAGGVLIPEMKKVALATAGGGHPDGNDHIHPSEMAKADWCPRGTYYRLKTGKVFDESFSFVLENIFDEGNEIHRKWQDRMRQTKKLWGSWRCRVCGQWQHQCFEPNIIAGRCIVTGVVHIWEYKEVPLEARDHLIWGHEDGAMCDPTVMVLDGYMVEIKSIGVGTLRKDAPDGTHDRDIPAFLGRYYTETVDGDKIYNLDKLWKELKRPLMSHVRQANVYLWLAEQMGLPFKQVRFLYEFKPNQQVKEFVITKSDHILEPLLTAAKSVTYALKSGRPPKCPHGGCQACRQYEEEENAGPKKPPGTAAAAELIPAKRVVRRREADSGPGDRPGPVGESPRARPSRRPARPDRGVGPRADEPLPVDPAVGEVPGAPAGGGRGRRVLRRKGSHQD